MKRLFYVIVFVYMFYRTVYGKTVENILTVEVVNRGEKDYFSVKDDITMSCKASNKNEKVEWINPSGEVVTRVTSNRVFVQEHLRGKSPALVLTITSAEAADSGVYSCQAEELMKNVSICVMDPVEFVEPTTKVIMDLGRSMTLTCPAKGDPEPKFSWYKNMEPISDEGSSKYRIMQTQYTTDGFEGQLTLLSLQPEDSGVYTCEALQMSPNNDACGLVHFLNITLNVRHGPIFDDSDTVVYTQSYSVVELRCLANAYPAPTYNWYKEDKDISYKLEGKLEVSDDRNESVLVVNPGNSFGQKFRCEASNKFGTADKHFTLAKIEKPLKPSAVTFKNASDNEIELSVVWNSKKSFPVDEFQIQYIKGHPNKRPKETAWRKSNQVGYAPEGDISDLEDIPVILEDLEEETDYWMRVRASNYAGESAWSDSIAASTIAKIITTTEALEANTTSSDEKPTKDTITKAYSDPTVYGIFFAGGILVVAVVCMFAMRMVK